MTAELKTAMKFVSVRTLFFMVLFLGSLAFINTLFTFIYDLSVRSGTRFGTEAEDLVDIVLKDTVRLRTAQESSFEHGETNAIVTNGDHVTSEKGLKEVDFDNTSGILSVEVDR